MVKAPPRTKQISISTMKWLSHRAFRKRMVNSVYLEDESHRALHRSLGTSSIQNMAYFSEVACISVHFQAKMALLIVINN